MVCSALQVEIEHLHLVMDRAYFLVLGGG